MATGFYANGVCYASQNEAINAHYESLHPVAVSGSPSILITSALNNGVWDFVSYTIDPATGSLVLQNSTPASLSVVGSCSILNDPVTNFQDGATIGWGVAAAMIITYLIRRPFR